MVVNSRTKLSQLSYFSLKLINDLDMKKTWYANDAVISCFLIKNGADVNMKNSNGCTPFSACSRTEVLSVVKKFYER